METNRDIFTYCKNIQLDEIRVTLDTIESLYPPRQSVKQMELIDLVSKLTILSTEPRWVHWFRNIQYMCELMTEYLLRGADLNYCYIENMRNDYVYYVTHKIETIMA